MKKSLAIVAVMAVSVAWIYSNSGRATALTGGYVYNDTLPDRPVYVDLTTGDTLDVWYNSQQGRMYNRRTNKPLTFYINTQTGDTVYGYGRMVVNGMVVRNANGTWNWDSTKVKVTGDKVKLKDPNKKWKMDASGKEKMKDRHRDANGDKFKAKTDKSGNLKTKGGQQE